MCYIGRLDFSREVDNEQSKLYDTFMPSAEEENYEPWELVTRRVLERQVLEGKADFPKNCFCYRGPYDEWDPVNNQYVSVEGQGQFRSAKNQCNNKRYGDAPKEFYNNYKP